MAELPDSTRTLARFVLATRYQDLDADLLRHVRRNIADCLGVALGGLDHRATALLLDHVSELGGAPQATVWGLDKRLNATRAALVNGHLANVLDFDDTLLSPDTILHVKPRPQDGVFCGDFHKTCYSTAERKKRPNSY